MNWLTAPRLSLVGACLLLTTVIMAQEEANKKTPPEEWETGAGLGFDFSQLLQINPKQGAGQNQIGFGGASNFFAIYRKDRQRWENQVSWQFGLQRLGSGIIFRGTDDTEIPFQKTIDELRISSKYAYKTSEKSRFSYASDFTFLSQVLQTFEGPPEFPGNFLTDAFGTGAAPLSQFFSPATITISVGMDLAITDNFSLFYSPFGGKFIIVASDEIAARGVHGNPVERDADGNITSFERIAGQLGSIVRANYKQKYLEGKLNYSTNLTLYSNYLNNPENIDFDWANQLGYELFKNFQITLLLNLFYDDDVLVQITDFDAPNGVSGLGRRMSLTQQLLLKYAVVF